MGGTAIRDLVFLQQRLQSIASIAIGQNENMDHSFSASHLTPVDLTPEPPKKRRHRWIWIVILLLFGLLFYWVLHQHYQSQMVGGRRAFTGAVPVTEATAKLGSIGVYLEAIGTVTSVYTDSINSQVTGLITAVHYREGQYVHKGDPLIDIDPRPYQALLVQAEGALQRDQNVLAEAKMDMQRYKVAWAKNAIPRQTLEDQEKLVLQEEGTVKNDEGQVQYDQVQVGFCHITSPINGRVGLRLVDPGNLVTANSTTSLAVVTQMSPITVIFTLAEDSLPEVLQQMRAGHQLKVEAYDRTDQHLLAAGRLITVDNQIDTVTGTVKLRAEFPNGDGILFPNQFVNARLLVKTLQNQVLIPSSSIQHNGSISFVYLIRNGKAVMQDVKEGISNQGQSAVTGIKPGDVVANSSFQKLVNGAQVFHSEVEIAPTEPTGGIAP